MRVGIEASNLREGGGVTHLAQLLEAADVAEHGIERVVVWSGRRTLDQLPTRPWLTLSPVSSLDGGLAGRAWWQISRLAGAARLECDLLFVPGGLYAGGFRPFVTMSRNLLPFESRERARFRPSLKYVKLLALRTGQTATFRRADGLIFLNEYARSVVLRQIGRARGLSRVVPHGVAPRFLLAPREADAPDSYSSSRPFRWLYVSTVDEYKHHPAVVRAFASLARKGLPLRLDLVGPGYAPSVRALERALRDAGAAASFVRYHGAVPHATLHEWYRCADAFVFASTCENMPNALLEAMAAGLPIACSGVGPMPLVLGDGGLYFDPLDEVSIEHTMQTLFQRPDLRRSLSAISHSRASAYSWTQTARETLRFLRDVKLTARRQPPEASA